MADEPTNLDEAAARIQLGVTAAEIIMDLMAKLQASRQCRDAAQAEATRLTLLNRQLAMQVVDKEHLAQQEIRQAFEEGFESGLTPNGASYPDLNSAWQRSKARQVAAL